VLLMFPVLIGYLFKPRVQWRSVKSNGGGGFAKLNQHAIREDKEAKYLKFLEKHSSSELAMQFSVARGGRSPV
jgi:hypothetical protein